jgi:lysophospholipase L1-like esterase
MPTMLVLGDSILWGQGLSEAQKCTTWLAHAWGQAVGTTVTVHRFAHSGADIWDDGQSGVLAALNPSPPVFPAVMPGDKAVLWTRPCQPVQKERDEVGELPSEDPYLLRQILDARDTVGPLGPVDLVVVDMGINDTAVYDLVLPGKQKGAVVDRARSMAPRVRFALDKIRATFPDARVLVTGYYAIVSRKSDLSQILQFTDRVIEAATHENVHVPWLPRLSTVPVVGRAVHDVFALLDQDLAARCAEWRDAMHEVLREGAAQLDAGRGMAAFVDPDFQPEHAVFAPETLLWPFVNGHPTDPRAGERRAWCDETGTQGFDRLVIECASMGHPSPAGAERYGQALIAAAQKIGLFVRNPIAT